LLVVVAASRWRQRMDVHEHGLFWTSWIGERTILRQDLRAVRFDRGYQAGHAAEVHLELGGETVSFEGLQQTERLAELLETWAVANASLGANVPEPQPFAAGAWIPPAERRQS
jgi:hypothetical protein